MSGDLVVLDRPERLSTVVRPTRVPIASEGNSIDAADSPHRGRHGGTAAASLKASIRGLYDLTKPRIVMMILITTGMSAMFLAGTDLSMWMMMHLMIGTAAVAGSASVMNQFIEREADAKMMRTMKRPLPSGLVSPGAALIFGITIGLLGTAYLAINVGQSTAFVGVATWVGYVMLYTPLKQKTAWNTTVGAIAGALPMMMGFAAAGGSLTDPRGWLLVAVLFLWQYPHFMAIAWMYRGQYADAGFKMTPVVEPTGKSAGWQAIAGALALPAVLITLVLPYNYAPLFAVLAVAASFGMIRSSFRFCGSPNDVTARQLLMSSLVQLPASLAVLIAARLLG
ncbi:Protoheme IX farnesyltransferase 1 [Rosistilla oblonga]|uniref:heme o synthase n=1 Tax=Rosistilla oblonga TaxID=2527990 RepID=UPI0011879A14|nr:heme o synthase [Rosistilla oblonga]QDV13680.1 Protoheme IX farnesyltransferase 1 [Rosistilla oblonga]